MEREERIVAAFGRERLLVGRRYKGLSGEMETNFLNGIVVPRVLTFSKSHQTIPLKSAHFSYINYISNFLKTEHRRKSYNLKKKQRLGIMKKKRSHRTGEQKIWPWPGVMD